MSDNPGLDAIIQQAIQEFVSDPANLSAEWIDTMTQAVAMNPVPVQATKSPAIIATGVGSSSNVPTRYVGGTTSGAPSTGTYVAGDFVVSHDGHVYICTATGTPGTWTTWAAQGGISTATASSAVNVTSTVAGTPTTVIAGVSATYTGDPIFIEVFADQVGTPSVAGGFTTLEIMRDGSVLKNVGTVGTPAASQMVVPFYVQYPDTPSAGTHTYGLAAYTSSTTGTPYVGSLVRPTIRTRFA